MRRNFFTPFKVGLLTLFAAVALAVGIIQVTKGGLSESDSYRVSAIFRDVSGLKKKSRVQIAGIDVGQVESIELVGARAKVTLRIRNDVPLYENATITKRSEGFIGDQSLDISPGDPSLPRIPDGGSFKPENVLEGGGLDAALEQLSAVGGEIQELAKTLIVLVKGDEEGHGGFQKILDDISSLSKTLAETVEASTDELQAILKNVNTLTRQVSDLAAGEEGTVRQILANIETITRDVQEVLATVRGVLGTGEGELKEGVASLRETLDTLDASLEEVRSVTGRLARGEGTVGKLLSDDALYDQIEDTVTDAGDFLDRLLALQTEVSLRTEYHLAHRSSREALQIRLIPREDKWYELALVSPPKARAIYSYETQSGGGTAYVRSENTDLRLNALFAKRWRFGPHFSITGRIGLIESTGGVGLGVGLLDDHLEVQVELFEFTNLETPLPRLRGVITLHFLEHLYVTGGVDDALNDVTRAPEGFVYTGPPELDPFGAPARSLFIGAGFKFTDEDLKAIITAVGLPSPG